MEEKKTEILDFFSKFPNEPFEFTIVTDINIKEHPNYYKAIFRNIEKEGESLKVTLMNKAQ